ncbi:MAG TPA: ribonuclease HII [Bacteroidia bacterium]|nr:ribonuclease HII [Bacteroidia bacterium]
MNNKLKPYYQEHLVEAGCDEAGRGCLAGPVFAAAVILPRDFKLPLLNDSKKLTEQQRERLRPEIEKQAIAWAVASVDHKEIDQINILNASFLAMNRAIMQLKCPAEYLIIDGNRFKTHIATPYSCIVEGDSKFASIAAASVLAKTHRDEYMNNLHKKFPHYEWAQNKGYGTVKHRQAIVKFGISPIHRKSFRLFAVDDSL